MDSINLIATLYKQELADANEQAILYKAQCKLYKQEIVTVETKIDKAALKKNIKAGMEIEGCHIEVGTSLTIPKAKKESK